MSTLILSLLLALLILAGMWMGRKTVERFVNVDAPTKVQSMSPTLVNMLATPPLVEPNQVNTLGRDIAVLPSDPLPPMNKQWAQVQQSDNMHTDGGDCMPLGNVVRASLERCKQTCDNDEMCNLINYNANSDTTCMLRWCEDPAKPALTSGSKGSITWSKPLYKPDRPADHPGPTPTPTPAPTVCPDMSQYIRLDEIPCWNCSLP